MLPMVSRSKLYQLFVVLSCGTLLLITTTTTVTDKKFYNSKTNVDWTTGTRIDEDDGYLGKYYGDTLTERDLEDI
jgi:hypothetical protein